MRIAEYYEARGPDIAIKSQCAESVATRIDIDRRHTVLIRPSINSHEAGLRVHVLYSVMAPAVLDTITHRIVLSAPDLPVPTVKTSQLSREVGVFLDTVELPGPPPATIHVVVSGSLNQSLTFDTGTVTFTLTRGVRPVCIH